MAGTIRLPIARHADSTPAVPDGVVVQFDGKLYSTRVIYGVKVAIRADSDHPGRPPLYGAEPDHVLLTPVEEE